MKISNKSIFTGALILSCVATNIHADGYIDPPPELWSGIYVGASVSGGKGKATTSYNQSATNTSLVINATPAVTTSSRIVANASGFLKGNSTGTTTDLFLGYNYHNEVKRYLLGGQIEGNIFNTVTMTTNGLVSTNSTTYNLIGTPSQTYNQFKSVISNRISMTTNLSAIARVGYLTQPNILVYGLFGATEGNFIISDFTAFNNINSTTPSNKSLWKLGYSAGGGIEHKFNSNWSAIAEYRYIQINNIKLDTYTSVPTQLTTNNLNLISTTNTSEVTTSTRNNFNMNVGKIGILYRI